MLFRSSAAPVPMGAANSPSAMAREFRFRMPPLRRGGLEDRKVRFIVDDVVKFVEREIRRGNKYDAIIMDPPSYGRGPKGEVWQI